MSDRLEKAFEYVKNTYFPRWDKSRKWKVEECSEELCAIGARGVDGKCESKTKTIKINMTRISKDQNDLYDLLIHEICHCHNLGHGESWQNAMFKRANIARTLGQLELSSLIAKGINHTLILDQWHEHKLQVKIFGHVKECLEKYPEISFTELMVKMVENHWVPETISNKWIKVYKGKYDYIKRRSMSSDCIHGLNPEHCDVCRQKTSPKEVMPQFSTKKDQYRSSPILEVLVNGEPWGKTYPWDEHFRFGVIRVKLILIFIDLIEKFVKTDGKSPDFGKIISRPDGKYNCTCVNSPWFTRPNGQIVNKPYMKLASDGYFDIGFGTEKAKALIEVLNSLKEFVNSEVKF